MQFYFTQVTTENAKKQDGSMEYKEHQNSLNYQSC